MVLLHSLKIFFLAQSGILHQISYPYTSPQNDVTERKHRHVMDIGLALLAHLGLQTKYWVDAFLTAIYFINHLPTPTLSKSTHSRCGIYAKC